MKAAGNARREDAVESVREALRACLDRPHGQAWGMPAGFYTSPEFLALEVDELFRKEWVCIGRVEEAAAPGDYWTVDLLGEPLLVVRGEDGRLKVYANVCRHRGTPVASGRGIPGTFDAPTTPGPTTCGGGCCARRSSKGARTSTGPAADCPKSRRRHGSASSSSISTGRLRLSRRGSRACCRSCATTTWKRWCSATARPSRGTRTGSA